MAFSVHGFGFMKTVFFSLQKKVELKIETEVYFFNCQF